MADSFATFYDDLRMMEAAMERAMNNEPLFDEDVPPIAQSHASILIAVDATGPFTNPFAAAAACSRGQCCSHDRCKGTGCKGVINFFYRQE
jgi:hypothetical protein